MALDKNLYRLTGLSTEPVGEEKGTRALVFILPQLLLVLVIAIVVYEISLGNQGEPFFWAAGVSVWPSEIIRLIAGILGCLFIAKAAKDLNNNKERLSKDFFNLNAVPVDEVSDIRIIQTGDIKRVDVELLWRRYCRDTSAKLRNPRLIKLFGAFVFLAVSLIVLFGLPNVPYRGYPSLIANSLVLLFCIPVFVWLVMTVIDATWRCVDLINQLSEHTSKWPLETLHRFDLPAHASINDGIARSEQGLSNLSDTLFNADKFHLDEWLDIELIAAHTKVVGKLVYYPFIILILMMFARSKIFDNWNMPMGLVLIFLSSAALTVVCAIYLRREAEKSRQKILRKIDDMKVALCLQVKDDERDTLEKQIELVTQKIEKINEGAFLPFTQEPAFQALLLPLGGWGGITLMEYFVLHGF